jgi:tetratricopeptide (TPR) repeat protein
MRLDPFFPPLVSHWLGLAYFTLKQYSQAASHLAQCAVRAPNYGAVHLWLAATHARLGQLQDARAEATRVLQLDPDFTIERVARSTITFKHEEDGENCFDAMREAGLPER